MSGKIKTRCGFTLIELLVVISIIALLLSIIAPSLSKVKEKSKFIVCANNEHQIGLAQMAYATDHDGHFTPGDYGFGATIVMFNMPSLGPNGPKNLGHLLEDGYLPVPGDSASNSLYCPGMSAVSPLEDWIPWVQDCWRHRYDGLTSGTYHQYGCGIAYEFRASMDGYTNIPTGNICKGVLASRVSRNAIVIDWNQSAGVGLNRRSWHKSGNEGGSIYNVLFGDGSVRPLNDGECKIIKDRANIDDFPHPPVRYTGAGVEDVQTFTWVDEYFGSPLFRVSGVEYK